MKTIAALTCSLLMICCFSALGDLPLPPPPASGATLFEALSSRRSERTFDERDLSPEELSGLLWSAFGVNRPESGKRTAPSARNWRQIDLYLALRSGLYRYDAETHRLVRQGALDLRAEAGRQAFTGLAPAVLIYVADQERMSGADAEARSFYAATDTGFISQNVYLYCAANGLHTVVLGMVDREQLAGRMGLGPAQRIVLTQPVGHPPAGASAPRPEPAAAGDATGAPRDGVFEGNAQGYDGEVAVAVTVEKGRIEEVRVLRHQESLPRRALTELPGRIVEVQGIEGVDTVTGATITSEALLQAVGEALNRSRGR